jgi:GT2 family glycosyltransferase
MADQPLDLSIIIVNYHSDELVKQCLQSFQAQMQQSSYEVIIVNNDDKKRSPDNLITKGEQVKWVEMNYNAGFARANNKGIELSKGSTVLLLNPDTIIIDNAIEKVFKQFSRDPFVACGLQLLNPDGTPQISGNYAMKGGLNYLLPLPYTGAFLKWVASLLKVKKPNVPDAKGTVEVDWINGAFLMVKKQAIEKAGLLDEDFFLYAEEAEWCSRLKKIGKLCIYGDIHVTHLQGETANDAFNSSGKGYFNLFDKKGLQIIVSNFLRIRKQFGAGWFFFDLAMYTMTIPVYLLIGMLHNIVLLKNPFSHFQKWMGFSKNVFQLWSYVPKMHANKPHFYKVL